ncbi:MAG: hypothetical protein ACTSU0_11495 [Alphaproteobacteria bacterium]
MIQAVMYFALGLLTAGLIALAVMPAFWRRAIRLTRARVEAGVPLTRAEINADKDQMRASFATSNRRLEMAIGRLTDRVSHQVVEINREKDAFTALRTEKQQLDESVEGLEKSVNELTGTLSETDDHLAKANTEIEQGEVLRADQAAALSKTANRLTESQQLSEAQRLEIVVLKTETGNISDQLVIADAANVAAGEDRDNLVGQLSDVNQALVSQTARGEGLEEHIGALQATGRAQQIDFERQAGRLRAADYGRAAIEAEIPTLTASVSDLHSAKTDLEARLQQVSSERRAHADDAAAKAAAVTAMEADLARERERSDGAEAEIAQLRRTLVDLERTIQSAGHEQEEQTRAVADLRGVLDDKNREHEELVAAVAALQTRRDQLDAELADARQTGVQGKQEIDQLRATIATTEQDLRHAQEAVVGEEAERNRITISLLEQSDTVEALNAELFAAVRKEEELEARIVEVETARADAQAKATTASIRQRTDAFTGGDNVRKALAAVEKEKAELTKQLAAAKRNHEELIIENRRLRRLGTGPDGQQTDKALSQRIDDIAAGVSEYAMAMDEPMAPPAAPPASHASPAQGAAPTIERAPARSSKSRSSSEKNGDAERTSDSRTLAERLRALQQPTVRP